MSIDNRLAAAIADLKRLKTGWRPGDPDLIHAVGLEDWQFGMDRGTNLPVLMGQSIGHPILGDRWITTSPVLWMSEDWTTARTVSRWYKLGRPAARALGITADEPGSDDLHPTPR